MTPIPIDKLIILAYPKSVMDLSVGEIKQLVKEIKKKQIKAKA